MSNQLSPLIPPGVYEVPGKTSMQKTYFVSWVVLWFFRWYHGSMKIDGTRTLMYWNHQLGESYPDLNWYVVNTWAKELLSLRFRFTKPDNERWNNQGGI